MDADEEDGYIDTCDGYWDPAWGLGAYDERYFLQEWGWTSSYKKLKFADFDTVDPTDADFFLSGEVRDFKTQCKTILDRAIIEREGRIQTLDDLKYAVDRIEKLEAALKQNAR